MSELRYDYSTGENLTLPAVFNIDGTMTARSIITSIGVFKYRNADGSIRRELRTPEAVFNDDGFIESVKNLPIYIGHQRNEDGTLITDVEKKKSISVGYTDDKPEGNNVYLATGVKVDRADGVDAIRKGMRSLSVGYRLDLDNTAGVWCGQEYDAIQKNIRADHLALVFSGRQGDQAVIRMDSTDAEMVTDSTVVVDANINSNKGGTMSDNMKVVNIDSVDYQAEAPVIVRLNSVQNDLATTKTRLDSIETELKATVADKSKIEAERDSLRERADGADKKFAELEASRVDGAMLKGLVAERMKLLDVAGKANVEVNVDMVDMDIKKAVISATYANANLDGKDDVYINARFDCACEDIAKAVEANGDASVRLASGVTTRVDSADSSKTAYENMVERMKTQHIKK